MLAAGKCVVEPTASALSLSNVVFPAIPKQFAMSASQAAAVCLGSVRKPCRVVCIRDLVG